MPTDPITAAPYLGAQDTPDLAGITADIAAWTRTSVVLHATSAADRDARFNNQPTIPNGTPCVTTQAPWFVWIKTGDASWATMFSDSGWVTDGFVPGASWAVGAYLKARTVGAWTEVRGEMTYTGGTTLRAANYSDPAPGNLSPDQTLVTVPSAYSPTGVPSGGVAGTAKLSGTDGAVQLYTGGAVVLSSIATNAVINNGDFCRFSFVFLAS